MKKFLFGKEELEIINHLLVVPPKKIWWNFISYTFDYDNYHISLECESKDAATQNSWDEAIVGSLYRKESPYIPTKGSHLVCKNKTITNIFIVRTFLYFSVFKDFSKTEKLLNKAKYLFKSLIKRNKDPLDNILSETTGSGAEYICQPKSKQAERVNPNFSNIIDLGLLLEIDGKFLRAFVETNSFGFHIWDDEYLFNKDEAITNSELYEFINVNN